MPRLLVDRRDVLKAAGVAFLAGLSPGAAEALLRTDAVFATGYRDASGDFGLALLTEEGRVVAAHRLPARAHGLTVSPVTGEIVAFARRPGTYAAVFRGNRLLSVIHTPADRHFFGHGCFSADGRRLFASENDFDGGRGVIGVYDATGNYRRIGEFPAHGIGTHDLALAPDGRHLVAANGGIATHPDFGRTKLNVDRMQPSLAFIDSEHGVLVDRQEPDAKLSRLSIRHIDSGRDGTIFVGGQYEGAVTDEVSVIGRYRPGEAIRWFGLPRAATDALAGYVGAIAVNRATDLVAATSPRGGAYVVIEGSTGRLVRIGRIEGVTALAPDGPGFAFSSENGAFKEAVSDLSFDQHMTRINRSHE